MLIYPSELAGKIEYDESGTLVPTCELTEEEQKIFDEFAEADKRESEERFNTDQLQMQKSASYRWLTRLRIKSSS